ncbi:xanthine dehydrogenase family protein molybdopterin-binding subunit [Aliikangiella marina]|uniref:Xanthine dehydrogenase family protein molybdopterin-binding subunit n=1 Tax=Aliikangiella marina TaxID=1712262 RepID=A0A545TCU5_9GAMM|nr:xanthine dehydrogenase family protein molybdopterin-binding subunit [Aliikangiella marina]TQV75011.1 xanthine dehydrogenase family protein molybdopterin-binding subunit [Aliikangiella marina]
MNFSRFVPQKQNLSRREFLKVSSLAAGAGFAIGSVPLVAGEATPAVQQGLGHFIKVTSDSLVTVVIKHLDKGQGVTTGLTAIVAEEMDADWSQMRWEFAPADATKYNNLFFGPVQGTGGSTAIANSWMQLRQAGAAAKHMMVKAAAKRWQVAPAEVTVAEGKIKHKSGKTLSFGDVASDVAKMTAPEKPNLKDPKDFKLIGSNIPRIDSPEKTKGKANYTLDVNQPGMLKAVIIHPPLFGATIKSLDKSEALKMKGVKAVVQTPRGVGIVADSYWTATQARQVVKIDWDESAAEKRGSKELWKSYKTMAREEGQVVRNDGDVTKAFKEAAKTINLEFEFPYLAHSAMEPMNCAVQIKEGQCDIWTGSQIPTVDQGVAASVVGLTPDKVNIHTQFAGGSFGRRAVPNADFVLDAVLIAKLSGLDAPINLQWSREDDMQAGYYRPMTYQEMKASFDDKGELSGWHQRVVSQSILRGTPFAGMIQGPLDMTLVEGGHNLPYAMDNIKVDGHEASVGVPVLWWRSVGHTHNAYSTEVFLDEVARTMGKDPVQFRLERLKEHPRHAGVLKLAAEKAGWGKKLPKNKAQGVAVHESFSSFVAEVAEVTVNDDGTYSVDKIVCAVDCGIAITPDVIKAQMEGGIGYGLGSCMSEAVTLTDGKVDQANFYNYFPMRMSKMPEIEVHIVQSGESPTGVGEPGTPPAGPAVANALRKFLKKPLTKLPFGDRLDLA